MAFGGAGDGFGEFAFYEVGEGGVAYFGEAFEDFGEAGVDADAYEDAAGGR